MPEKDRKIEVLHPAKPGVHARLTHSDSERDWKRSIVILSVWDWSKFSVQSSMFKALIFAIADMKFAGIINYNTTFLGSQTVHNIRVQQRHQVHWCQRQVSWCLHMEHSRFSWTTRSQTITDREKGTYSHSVTTFFGNVPNCWNKFL